MCGGGGGGEGGWGHVPGGVCAHTCNPEPQARSERPR